MNDARRGGCAGGEACVRVCVRASVRVCVCACVRIVRAYNETFGACNACVRACVHTPAAMKLWQLYGGALSACV